MSSDRGATPGVPYLRIENLSKRFGSFEALRDISLEIADREFVCFLGPSGCGKTTLLRAIAGLDIQSSGRVEQAGVDNFGSPSHRTRLRDRVPVLRPVSESERLAQCRLRAREPEDREEGGGAASHRIARTRRIARTGREVSRAALGRATAACRARARNRHLSRTAPARRAAFRTGCESTACTFATKSGSCSVAWASPR